MDNPLAIVGLLSGIFNSLQSQHLSANGLILLKWHGLRCLKLVMQYRCILEPENNINLRKPETWITAHYRSWQYLTLNILYYTLIVSELGGWLAIPFLLIFQIVELNCIPYLLYLIVTTRSAYSSLFILLSPLSCLGACLLLGLRSQNPTESS